MNGIVYTKTGQLDGLIAKHISRPNPGPRQVTVQVRASSINYQDYWPFKSAVERGRPLVLNRFFMNRFLDPLVGKVPGCDVAGTVVAVGNDVRQLEVGDKVFGVTDDFRTNAWAEFACIDERNLAFTPSNLGFLECATLPMAAGTAVEAVNAARLQAGQKCLIIGSTGGVGLYVTQLAKSIGATVTSVCRPEGAKVARRFGVDQVIDANQSYIKDLTHQFDAIIVVNGRHSLNALRKLLEPNGYYVEVHQQQPEVNKNPFGNAMEVGHRWHAGQLSAIFMRQSWLWKVANLAQKKAIRPYLDVQYSINNIQTAIKYAVNHHVNGKVGLTMDFMNRH